MVLDRETNKNLEPQKIFEQKLQALSNPPESARPIESATNEDVAEIRRSLEKAGFNLNLSPEALESLRHKQFRSLDQGKGPAIVASLGKERAEEIFKKCEEIAVASGSTQRFPTGGAGIGLKHTLADFIALSVLPAENRERIIQNLNQRVYLGYDKTQREIAGEAFAQIPPVSEPTKKATVPVGSVMKLWEYLTSK